jgi:hypothetical protein
MKPGLKNSSRIGRVVLGIFFFLAGISSWGSYSASAADDKPNGPDRFGVLTVDYTNYSWWLSDWGDNQVACSLNVDHEGVPTRGEVFTVCGKVLYDEWVATKPCITGTTCSGYYLQLVKSEPAQKKVGVSLPPPVVWVSLQGCTSIRSTFKCNALPSLVLSGEEPMSGEHITGLVGRRDGVSFTCDALCLVDLAPTGSDGTRFEFWADSSYGDSSVLFTARVRVSASDDPNDPAWYVDVLSSQWQGAPLAACSLAWDSFPPVGGVSDWLTTPEEATSLATELPYQYLAANLIQHGVVDASSCSDGGMLGNGMASQCGTEASQEAVISWQNSFDGSIFDAAQQSGVPARLLKTIFSRESQFWPGASNGSPEAGLGQMTGGGADTTLLWNQSFYEQFCPSALDGATCKSGYAQLSSTQQDILRSALVASVDATCPGCEMGLDLERSQASVGVFAETLVANCDQAGWIVHNTYGRTAGVFASYEDLWRFTLVNYHSGPGCLTLAIWETKKRGEPLDWEHLSSHLTPVCNSALDYVNFVSLASP